MAGCNRFDIGSSLRQSAAYRSGSENLNSAINGNSGHDAGSRDFTGHAAVRLQNEYPGKERARRRYFLSIEMS